MGARLRWLRTLACLVCPATAVQNLVSNALGMLEVMAPHNGSKAVGKEHEESFAEGRVSQHEAAPGGCRQTATAVHCDAQQTTFGKFKVYFQTPTGQSWQGPWGDSAGVVLFFHGSDLHDSGSFSHLSPSGPYSARMGSFLEERVQTIKTLLENGFAVVSPQAQARSLPNDVLSFHYWEVEKMSVLMGMSNWTKSDDASLMRQLFDKFKRIGKDIHAVGFSSGSYHVGRVGNDPEFGSSLNTLSILSGGYAWNGKTIAPNHPPTQFLYGTGDDFIDVKKIAKYNLALQAANVETRVIEKACSTNMPGHGRTSHMWIPDARNYILEWVTGHRGARM